MIPGLVLVLVTSLGHFCCEKALAEKQWCAGIEIGDAGLYEPESHTVLVVKAARPRAVVPIERVMELSGGCPDRAKGDEP